MPYLYLIGSVAFNATLVVFGEFFNRINIDKKDTSPIFNLLQALSVCVIWWLLFLIDFEFEIKVLLYSLFFAVCFTAFNFSMINALKNGPAVLTMLIINLSLILTTVWGFIFWDAPITPHVVCGLVLVVVALVLCIYNGKKDEKKVNFKWLIFVALSFFGNAGCSIIQRTQQMVFNGKYGNMLMAFATLMSLLFFIVAYIRSNKEDNKVIIERTWFLPVGAGACNVFMNILVMLLATSSLSSSLIYPVIGVGSLAIVTVFSLFAFKEKIRWWQWIGILAGAVATVLLSI